MRIVIKRYAEEHEKIKLVITSAEAISTNFLSDSLNHDAAAAVVKEDYALRKSSNFQERADQNDVNHGWTTKKHFV